jgi:hypothetical protein
MVSVQKSLGITNSIKRKIKAHLVDANLLRPNGHITTKFMKDTMGFPSAKEFWYVMKITLDEVAADEKQQRLQLKKAKRRERYHENKGKQAVKTLLKNVFENVVNNTRVYILDMKVKVDITFANSKTLYPQVMEQQVVLTHAQQASLTQDDVSDRALDLAAELERESSYDSVEVTSVTHTVTEVNQVPADINTIKMRDAGALLLDGDDPQVWDTKNGRCVFDYFIHTYGSIKGFKKMCNYERLRELFRDPLDPEDDPLVSGVSTHQILGLCKELNISMYALDEDERMFNTYLPPKRNHHAPPLIFRLRNNHFYPVSHKSKRDSIVARAKDVSSDVFRAAHRDAGKKPLEKPMECHEGVADPSRILIEKIIETDALPSNLVYDGQIRQFEYDGKVFFINNEVEDVQGICNAKGLPYTGQGISGVLFDIIHKAKVEIPKSQPNPAVMETLLAKHVKARTHYGCVNNWTQETIDKQRDDAVCCDISKCHSACMYDPYDKWIVIDYNDMWQPFDGKLTLGLYQVRTDDNTLLHGSNIYSNSILKKAQQEEIAFTIVRQLKAAHYAPRDLFVDVLDEIKSLGSAASKKLNNILSGYLGKSDKKYYDVRLNTDLESVWSWFVRRGVAHKDVFVKTFDLADDRSVYLYGKQVKAELSENNVPMFIQLKDFSNMRLYDMIKAMGGKLAFRKVDCAIVMGGELPPLSNEWGGYRLSSMPSKLGAWKPLVVKFKDINKEWTDYPVNDSSAWQDIKRIAVDNRGVLIQGRAGTGKTYVSSSIAATLDHVQKLAPTNKACLVLKGKTLHKFLQMDANGFISRAWIYKIRRMYRYFIVDEISMISKTMWKRLVELKKLTGATFILVGDKRQCAPVETENYEAMGQDDYFDHPAVKFLANYNRIELEIPHRYDMQLWQMLEDVDGLDTTLFPTKCNRRNVSFFVDTTRNVNHSWNLREKDDNSLFLEDNVEDEYTQSMYVYEGLPVMARVTKKDGSLVNNETYAVSAVEADKIRCETLRTNDDGDPVKHIYECPSGDFIKTFLMSYCTTVHKSQGETIMEDYTIWDWKAMSTKLRYTALSRAQTPGQVSIDPQQPPHAAPWTNKQAIVRVLKSLKSQDSKKNRVFSLSYDDVMEMHAGQSGLCCHCHESVSFVQRGNNKWSIDRKDNRLGHIKSNCQLSCWACNRAHKNRF